MTQSTATGRGASHYARGTVADMARSMAVILGLTLVVFLVVARTNATTPERVDVPAAAQSYAAQAGQPFAYAEGLPEGWTPVSARYTRSRGEVLAWNAGYSTPDGQWVSVQQAVDAPDEWIRAQTNYAPTVGTLVTDDGRRWSKRDREGKVQRSLVHDPTGSAQLTTIVTGTGSWAQLQELAEHLAAAKG